MRERLHLVIRGAVQGVGFRPFIFRLAAEMALKGWVLNSSQGVFLEVEGERPALQAFLVRIEREKPPASIIQGLEPTFLDPVGYGEFEIRHSVDEGGKTALVLPDIATCRECRREIFDCDDRRYQYPFTNCTHCGPRYTIIQALPYDRAATTMSRFRMCDACRTEYEDPMNRRFHAQPNACPDCGPHLEFWGETGEAFSSRHEALLMAAQTVRGGGIVAVKGLGGFHLIVDARNEAGVRRLRERKRREEKPFALMYPTFHSVHRHCRVSDLEERLLRSPESPIILLERTGPWVGREIAPSVAPRNPNLGVMLPYTPLHLILMAELGFPVVATSANLSDEPICTDPKEALSRLGGIADAFLVHNRPIHRHADDSVVRVMMGREMVVRRARGYAPLPIQLSDPAPALLAVGGQLKNNVAISVGRNVFVSQHVGDLETREALDSFERVIRDLAALYEMKPERIACDMHPDYASTGYAKSIGPPVVHVQHHYAHVTSCAAENRLEGPLLGVAWDGTGYGGDGTIWGGEFLRIAGPSFRRVASLRTFRLPGVEKAVREPRRSALGLLHEIYGESAFGKPSLKTIQSFNGPELRLLRQMLMRGVQSPQTSSAGRLFDALASLVGLRQRCSFEGQAAMELEFSIPRRGCDESYSFGVLPVSSQGAADGPELRVDWEPMVREVIQDLEKGTQAGLISARFHNMLAEVIVEVAERTGEERVVLSGGCFQNKYLT